jgi:hypothetical protein
MDLLLTARLTNASVISLNLGRETWTIRIKLRMPPMQAQARLGALLVAQWLAP